MMVATKEILVQLQEGYVHERQRLNYFSLD
jgi:hypothetical protein